MEIIFWVIIICFFILSLIGVFVPIIPAVVFLWLGFLMYHFFINGDHLSILFWIMMGLFTVMLIGSDIVTNHYFVHKFGGSKTSQWGAIVGVVIGAFIYPPFGLIIAPFIIVLILEVIQKRTLKEASLASVGAIAGFLSGVAAKMIIQIVMIIWFILAIIF